MDKKEKNKLIEKYHNLTEELEKTVAEIYPDNVKIDVQKAELKQAKQTSKELSEQIAELEKEIDFYSKNDKVKEMVDFVNNSPYLVFESERNILLDRSSGLLLQNIGNYEHPANANEIVKDEQEKNLDDLGLYWELLTESELQEFFTSFNELCSKGEKKGKDFTGSVDIRKSLKLNSYILHSASRQHNSLGYHPIFNMQLCKPHDEWVRGFSILLKCELVSDWEVKDFAEEEHSEISASEFINELADDGLEITNKEILRVAQAYCKKLQLTEELKEIEEELKLAKIKKPKPRKKTKNQAIRETLSKGFAFNFSTEEIDVFAYRSEVSKLIQDSITELRSFTADNLEEQAEFINSIKDNFKKLNFHNTSKEEKMSFETLLDSEVKLLDCSPEELIRQFIAFQQEIESLTNDAVGVSFTGMGLTKLAAVLQSQIPTLESALNYIECRKAEYISKYEYIAENRETVLQLIKQQVEHINQFSSFLETGRKKFLSDAAKEKTDISITDRLWAMLRELRVQLLDSYSELLNTAISGKFDIEKMEEIQKELQNFEGKLDKTFSKNLQKKKLTLLTLQFEIDTALQEEYVEFRKVLHAIKYEN